MVMWAVDDHVLNQDVTMETGNSYATSDHNLHSYFLIVLDTGQVSKLVRIMDGKAVIKCLLVAILPYQCVLQGKE